MKKRLLIFGMIALACVLIPIRLFTIFLPVYSHFQPENARQMSEDIVYFLAATGDVYETNAVEDYGDITGTSSDDEVRDYHIFTVFPRELGENFQNVEYHYKGITGARYAYECYLEFTVEDPREFAKLVEKYTDPSSTKAFSYDPSFQDYTLSNDYWVTDGLDAPRSIIDADVQKVLYREEDRRMIFVSFGVGESGWIRANELRWFFDRFQIDALDYDHNATDYFWKRSEQNVANP